jgi:3-oxoadipate enol-lactonase
MPTITANGIDIRYELLGTDLPSPAHGRGTSAEGGLREGPVYPLVLAHGFASGLDTWIDEVRPLADERPLLMYDVRGHGQTTVPPDPADYSMPAFAADLAALLRALNIERAHVGGVSMGGMVTAQFAVDFPEMCESVLIIDSACGNAAGDPPPEGPAADWERRLQTGFPILMQSVRERGLEQTVRREWAYAEQNDPHFADSPYTLEDNLRRIKLMTPEGYLGAAQAIIDRPDLTGHVSSITAPTLVMIGAWDDFLPCARRDHGLIPGSRLVIRERCGHGSRWRLDTFLAEVEHFLDDVEAARPIAGERTV